MNFYFLIPLMAVLLMAILIGSILASQKNDPKKYSLLLLNICLMIWGLIDVILWMNKLDNNIGASLEKVISICWLSAGFFFLNFVYALLNKKRDIIYLITIICTIIIIILSLSTDKIVSGISYHYWGAFPTYGPWILPIVGIVVFPMIYGLIIIGKAMYHEKNFNLKNIYKNLLFGVSIAIGVDVTIDVLLPVVFNYNPISLAEVGNSMLSLFLLWIVNRHRFLELSFEEISQSIFEKINDGIVITTESGEVLMMNNYVKQLLNNHTTLQQIIDPANSNSSIIKTKINNPQTGENIYLNISNNLITDNNRKLHLYLLNDVSELVKYRNSLIDKNEELLITLYRIGHDIKNPSFAIKQLTDFARQDKDNSELYLEKIDVSITQLINFIKEVENVIRLKEALPSTENIDLNIIIKRCWNELEFYHQKESHQLETDFQINNFKSDPLLVYSIILNIISNSIKYNDIEKKRINIIRVESILKDNFVEISISDNGAGMDQTTCDNIYKLFYRGNTNLKGAGLGMYIVKNAIENLNGEIIVTSKLGEGTRFTIKLPIKK